MKQRADVRTIASVAQLVAVFLTVAALYLAREVFIPLSLGLLLSFLLSPIVERLRRFGVPNVLAVIATALLAFVLLGAGFTIVGKQLSVFVAELPQHKEELLTKARRLGGLTSGMGGSLDDLADDVSEAIVDAGEEASAKTDPESPPATGGFRQWADRLLAPGGTTGEADVHDGTTPRTPLFVQSVKTQSAIANWAVAAGTVLGPLATAGLVSVFALFLLIYREDLRDRIIAAVSHGNYVTTTEALDEVARRISRYLIAQSIINASYGFVLAAGLLLIGGLMTPDGIFPNAILWGFLATFLRFIPYLGPIASAIFPLAIALSVFPGYGVFLAVLTLIVVLELVSNNLIEPWLYGTSTGISAVAIIVSVVFWAWLWGPIGLLLSTPLTVCLVVLGRHVPRFKILTTLLGEDVEIKSYLRFYQRLLANDQHRARELLLTYTSEGRFDACCDEVLIPTFKRVRADHDAEKLSDDSYALVVESLVEIVEETDWYSEPDSASKDSGTDPPIDAGLDLVIGCPSHHASESSILDVMRKTSVDLWRMELLDEDTMPAAIGTTIAYRNPAVAVIMVLPAGGFVQARFLCKTIRKQGYQGAIVIACMGKFKHFDRLFVRFRKVGATSMTTSFRQTRSKVRSMVDRMQHDSATSQPQPAEPDSNLPQRTENVTTSPETGAKTI